MTSEDKIIHSLKKSKRVGYFLGALSAISFRFKPAYMTDFPDFILPAVGRTARTATSCRAVVVKAALRGQDIKQKPLFYVECEDVRFFVAPGGCDD